MSQVLLIEDNQSIRGIIKLNAKNLLGIDLIEKNSMQEAISLIRELPGLDLIICREEIEGSFDIVDLLLNEKLDIPLIWIGEKHTPYKYNIIMPKDSHWKKILEVAGETLGIDLKSRNEKSSSGYEAVDCHYFLNINSASVGCDVYLKIRKDGSDHYVKCLHHNDQFTRADIEKYITSGLTEFYVLRSHFNEFVNFITEEFIVKLHEEKLKGRQRVIVTGDAYKITMARIQSLELDAYTVDVVEASIKSMTASIKEDSALGVFLKLLEGRNFTYAYANAYLLSLMLHKVAGQFDWCTKSIMEKLTYAAYFHNCSFKDERLMKILTYEEFKTTKLTVQEREVVFGHAQLSALLVEGISSVPGGVSTIIREHHGAKNGFGFPKNLNTSISKISMMFIVLEDFVDEFLKISDRPSKGDYARIYAHLKVRYTTMTYAQTLKILHELVFEKHLG